MPEKELEKEIQKTEETNTSKLEISSYDEEIGTLGSQQKVNNTHQLIKARLSKKNPPTNDELATLSAFMQTHHHSVIKSGENHYAMWNSLSLSERNEFISQHPSYANFNWIDLRILPNENENKKNQSDYYTLQKDLNNNWKLIYVPLASGSQETKSIEIPLTAENPHLETVFDKLTNVSDLTVEDRKQINEAICYHRDVMQNLKFKLVIGKGNFGRVKLGREILFPNGTEHAAEYGKFVAIKKADVKENFSPTLESEEYRFSNTFLKNNEQVVKTYTSVAAENSKSQPTSYDVMEFMDYQAGKKYIDYIASLGSSAVRTRLLGQGMVSVLEAVAELHQQSVFHCDIKPENFLIDQSGQFKVSDFGSSKGYDEHNTLIESSPLSDITYWSPEKLVDEKVKLSKEEKQHKLKLIDSWATGLSLLQFQGVNLDEYQKGMSNFPKQSKEFTKEIKELIGPSDSRGGLIAQLTQAINMKTDLENNLPKLQQEKLQLEKELMDYESAPQETPSKSIDKREKELMAAMRKNMRAIEDAQEKLEKLPENINLILGNINRLLERYEEKDQLILKELIAEMINSKPDADTKFIQVILNAYEKSIANKQQSMMLEIESIINANSDKIAPDQLEVIKSLLITRKTVEETLDQISASVQKHWTPGDEEQLIRAFANLSPHVPSNYSQPSAKFEAPASSYSGPVALKNESNETTETTETKQPSLKSP